MKTPDLDRLRERWAEQGRRIDDHLSLDLDAVRATLNRRVSKAFAWYRRRRVMGLVIGGACLVALLSFIVAHRGQWDWMALAGALVPLLIAEIVVDLREWRVLRRIDMAAPVMQVREVLNRLRGRRLRLAKAYIVLSILLWWPFVLVVFKGLFGADLLHALPPSVLLVNALAGLAFIPVSLVVAWGLHRRFGHAPGWQRFLDDSVGATWRRASDELAVRESFEAAVGDGSAEDVLASSAMPDAIHQELHALRRHLLIGILSCAALVLLFGLFNAHHGGQAHFIIAGTLMLWSALAHMVVQILHRNALSGFAGGTRVLGERLTSMLALRRRVAMATIVLSPLGLPVFVLVAAKALFGIDLIREFSLAALGSVVVLAGLATVLLWWSARRARVRFAPRLVNTLCLGFQSRTEKLLARLSSLDHNPSGE